MKKGRHEEPFFLFYIETNKLLQGECKEQTIAHSLGERVDELV